MGKVLAPLALSALVLSLLCVATSGSKLLVLLQDNGVKSQCSKFFSALEEAGVSIEYKPYREAGLKLREYDTWMYDHLALFAPKAEGFGGSIDVPAILEFVDSGRDLIVVGSSQVSETIRTLAAEVGVDLDDKGTSVFDHFSHALGADGQPDHTLVVTTDIVSSSGILGSDIQAPLLFRGVAASVPSSSELVTVVASASPSAYSHDPRRSMVEPPALMAGAGISLLSLVQARNNARVLISGSLDLFSNELFDAEVTIAPAGKQLGKSANEAVTTKAALWTLQQRGVLKATNMRHRLLSQPPGSLPPSGYRVMDEVEFAVDLFVYEGGKKAPYQATDVQVEFVMLDPYIRLPLRHEGNGTYSLQFKVPDVYGVFKYVIDYKHLGYSYVSISRQVPVRPFKHNEYERFLVCAYPYYASALSSMLAFFFLGFFFLYHK